MPDRPNHQRRYYLLVALLFLFAGAYQVAFSISAIEFQRRMGRTESLFTLALGSDRFDSVAPPLSEAGVHPRDQLLEVEGQSYTGGAQIARILAAKRSGDSLSLKIRRHTGATIETISLPLLSSRAELVTATDWIVFSALNILTPVFCLGLGFFVAAARPRDPLAWLVLALMLSFAQLGTAWVSATASPLLLWPDIVRPAAIFYHTLCFTSWSIWVLLFGIYFPERLPIDRRRPWIKWLLMGPIGLSAIGTAVAVAGNAENFRVVSRLPALLTPLGKVTFYLSMAAISSFFLCLWSKIERTTSSDARRRLILLVNGTSVALGPIFILVIYSLIRGGFGGIPDVIWIPCLLMLSVFPITLAYVIVVQRALDVRVVIRQGLQYALAKRAMLILQIIASGAVIVVSFMLATDPARNLPRKITAIGFGVAAIAWMGRGSEHLRGSIDRRFFREVYDAEKILSELSNQVRTIVETGPLLETVGQRISNTLHVPNLAMLVKENGCYAPAYALGYAEPLTVSFEESAGIIRQLKQNRDPLRVYNDDPDSWLYREPGLREEERERLRILRTQLLLPLSFRDKLIGFISLGQKKSEEPYSASDVRLLGSVATQMGLALENSKLTEAVAAEVAQRERLNRELEIAREVQERLFPQTYTPVLGLDYAGRCRPALGVGGDYYDFLELQNGGLGVAIGDVSGKGVPAALLMASLQACLRSQTISGPADLAKLMSNMNRLIFESTPPNRYATFFYGQYDPASRMLTYVNAGHNAPMVFRGEKVLRLEDGGPVVGLFKPARYTQAALGLEVGDILVLFTDGISEAMNAADEEWGEDRLIDAVSRCHDQPANGMIDSLVRGADDFVGAAPQHDDMTLVVVKLIEARV